MPTISPTDLGAAVRTLIEAIAGAGIADGERMVWLRSPNALEPDIEVLGPDLYTGMAGMALTFANAFRVTGQERYGAIARHAILHALDHADAIPEEQRLGFYNGWSGIAYAAVCVHSLLGYHNILLGAEKLLKRLEHVPVEAEFDLMAGAAGAVLGAAAVAPVLVDVALRTARSAAEGLREAAAPAEQGAVSWPTAGEQLPLTGASHGQAGIGWALLELYGLTGTEWLRELADGAFRYERQYFDQQTGNWHDLRHYASADTLKKIPPKAEIAWCHGAGGIALSRLRAWEITHDAAYLPELSAAARTLEADVRQSHPWAELPSCLCHGLVGNLDILLTLRRRAPRELTFLSAPLPFDAELAAFVADLPPEPPDPGLMLGIGGLAHYLMRRMDGGVGSVLYPVGVGGGA